jgi:hypothetical protein
MSLFLLIGSTVVYSSLVFGVKKNKESETIITPDEYNPLKILPPGVKPSPTPTPPQQKSYFSTTVLTGVDLENCKSHLPAIMTESNAFITKATDMEKQLISLHMGVEQYYQSVILPSGKILPGYDALLAQELLTEENFSYNLKEYSKTGESLTCTSNNPQAAITQLTLQGNTILSLLQTQKRSLQTTVQNASQKLRVLKATPIGTASRSITPTIGVPTR